MKYLYFDGKFNSPLLMEELFSAFPNWMVQGPKFLGKVVETDTGVRVTVPFDEDIPAATTIVNAHNHTKKSKNEMDREKHKKDRVKARAKLVGLGLTKDEIDSIVGND